MLAVRGRSAGGGARGACAAARARAGAAAASRRARAAAGLRAGNVVDSPHCLGTCGSGGGAHWEELTTGRNDTDGTDHW